MLHTTLTPWIFVPLYERLSGQRPWTELRRLHALQWRAPEELEARAVGRLHRLLAHAHAHVPHYRDLFVRAGMRPADIRTLADLSRLPLTGKAELRARFPADVVAHSLPARRGERGHTSGSTGVPFEFYLDRSSWQERYACALFFQSWTGAAPGAVWVAITPRLQPASRLLDSRRLRDVARRVLLGERLVLVAGLDDTTGDFLAALGRLPRGGAYYVGGLTSYVARLARDLLRAGIQLPVAPRVALIGSESHTAADVAAIESAFRCPVVIRYGAAETWFLAQSCPDNAAVLHVNSERAIVRVVDDEGNAVAPGEAGRVVVTDLGNWVMPFINYDLGDYARAGPPCPCGRGFPTLLGIEGRLGEVIRTPAGKIISPGAMSLELVLGQERSREALGRIREYQVVQTAADAIVLRVVPAAGFSPEFARALEEELASYLRAGLGVRVEPVERLAVEPSGKRRVIISELGVPERPASH